MALGGTESREDLIDLAFEDLGQFNPMIFEVPVAEVRSGRNALSALLRKLSTREALGCTGEEPGPGRAPTRTLSRGSVRPARDKFGIKFAIKYLLGLLGKLALT